MQIFNTLSGQKEEFKPIEPRLIRIYICGPTVYDHSHIGHGRTYVIYDVLERYLRYRGYDVAKTINITDIDDKMIKRAKELDIEVKQLAEIVISSFIEDLYNLNVLFPEFMPRATHHIEDMIKLIEKLIEKGYAYEADGDIYFSVNKYKEYGKLSKQSLQDLIAGQRIRPSDKKKNPLDFALWKKRKTGEPFWKSPWGDGRPGWHIECSAMSMKLLGETFDIHGGGEDLIFPHHENEKAQSEAATGKQFARYWMHCGLVTINEEEMSKSKGNVISLKEILNKYDSDTLRTLYLSTHYRSQLEFSWERLENAKNLVDKMKNTYERIKELIAREKMETAYSIEDIETVYGYREKILGALEDDLNTALALSEFMSFIRWVNRYLEKEKRDEKVVKEAITLFREIFYIFGLRMKRKEGKTELTENLIEILIDVRKRLRNKKDYENADYIREKLMEIGVILEDIGDETKYYYS